jgi:dephospho-CoA kinase
VNSDALILEVGLTGGIASGKSTVGGMLEMFGAHIIDADDLVHQMLGPGHAEQEQVVARFGAAILGDDGAVNRKALAAIVFSDPGARADLNAILHPAVRREEALLKAGYRGSGGGIIITDAALLVETGRHQEYDRLIVVACDPALQVSRLLAREPKMKAAEAQERMAAQAPLANKLAVADYVIDTSGSFNDTEERAHAVYQLLIEDLEAKRGGESLPQRPRPAPGPA